MTWYAPSHCSMLQCARTMICKLNTSNISVTHVTSHGCEADCRKVRPTIGLPRQRYFVGFFKVPG